MARSTTFSPCRSSWTTCAAASTCPTRPLSPRTPVVSALPKVVEEAGRRTPGLVHKTRDTTRPNVAVANRVVGDVAGKECVLVDDMIDTAGTITEAINVLTNAGTKKVIVVATHGILSDPAAKRLSESGAAEVVVHRHPADPC